MRKSSGCLTSDLSCVLELSNFQELFNKSSAKLKWKWKSFLNADIHIWLTSVSSLSADVCFWLSPLPPRSGHPSWMVPKLKLNITQYSFYWFLVVAPLYLYLLYFNVVFKKLKMMVSRISKCSRESVSYFLICGCYFSD